MSKKPSGPRIFYYFLKHYQKIGAIMESTLKEEGLTAGQYTILSALKRFEPCTSAELARGQEMTAQSMGAYLATLEAKGLVERSYEDGDRRSIIVRRTAKGVSVQEHCDALVMDAEAKYLSPISADAQDGFIRHLIKLYRQ
jgi:DNA-binding MarR family transcriptional regulator